MIKKPLLQEISENETGKKEENKEDGDNDNEIVEWKTQQQIHQAIEKLVNFSIFIESG